MRKESKEYKLLTYRPEKNLTDRVNLRIVNELSEDPRMTMAELGRRVNLTSPAVTERVRGLEEAGVIKGYRLEVDPTALGLPITAYVRIRPKAGQLSRIAGLAKQIAEVVECHRITGEDCFILKVHLPSLEQMDLVLDEFNRYGSTTTSLVQSSPVELRPLPILGER